MKKHVVVLVAALLTTGCAAHPSRPRWPLDVAEMIAACEDHGGVAELVPWGINSLGVVCGFTHWAAQGVR